MRHLLHSFTLLLSLSLWMFGLQAQKYSNEFLSIGVGARAQAMGNSVVASTNDIYAGVWNPAGLAALTPDDGLQIGAMHSEWFGGVGKFDYLGFTLPTTQAGNRLAFSLVRFGIDQIPNTLSLYESDGSINFDNLREFSAADYGFFGSYAKQIDKPQGPLRIGGSVKVVHRRIGPFATSWGFGADLGVQLIRDKWTWGLMAKDITTTFNAWSFSFTQEEKDVLELTNNEVPINSVEITRPQLIFGGARLFTISQKVTLLSELNLAFTSDGQRNTLISADPISIDPSLGLEMAYRDFLLLRAGVNQFQYEQDFSQQENLTVRPSMGIGLRLGSLLVDYAYTDLGDNRNTFSHVISLKLGLKPRKR
ncbi:MAG: hypothetical protein DA408_05135 [Bacteroidetes bacterium]|nr:MAG: hypothetical protein C7N36_16530 [Bacteroidota bacterium]PTM13842.1 MAG: hypothetical protein DA408_05135 [Bacteroidota bacterium]